MKIPILYSLLTASPVAFLSGAVVYDFELETSGDLFESEVAGWSQDSINPFAFGQTFPLAYVASTDFGFGSTNAGHLGTQFANTADNSSTTLTGLVNVSPEAGSIPRVTVNLAVLDDTSDSFAGRDAFSVALTDQTNQELASVGFTPTFGDDLSWDVSVSVNGAAPTVTLAQIDALAGYLFIMDFASSGTSFLYGPSQGTTSPVLISNQAAVPGFSVNISNVEMTHIPLAPAGTSANTLAFDNIVVSIPEPGSALMVLLSGVLLARRRRS